jgi:phosphoglycolate/pyridoxal phosphate phosphatase family enzyme
MDIRHINGFIFDLDGTVYLGDALLPAAKETIEFLKNKSKKVLFISNKPLESRFVYAEKLTRLGIPTDPDGVVTSGYVLAFTLKERYPDISYYVVGEENIKSELKDQGLHVHDELHEQDGKQVIDTSGIDAIIVSFDRTLDYRKLNTAYQALIRGAHYFATNPDKTCPMPGGDIPDAGATLAAIEHLTGRKPEVLAGKPSKLMVDVALKKMGLLASECMIIGDRLETDIRMGIDAGMNTGVVLTGITTLEQARQYHPQPDLIIKDLSELMHALKSF